jgi:hypothetical protein
LLTGGINPSQQEFESKPVSDEHPLSGIDFTLDAGDSLQRIAEAVSALGHPLTAQEILKANPGLDPARLMIGQKIFIPLRAP